MRRALVASLCMMLAGVLSTPAQERIRDENGGPSGGDVRKASALMGSKVNIREGDALGEVVDLVINDSGCIDFLVVRSESDYIAVPWSVAKFNGQQRSVMVNSSVTRAKLRDVTFTRDRWPNFYGGTFNRNMRTVWGEGAFRRGNQGVPEQGNRGVRQEERRTGDREPGRTAPPPQPQRNPSPKRPPNPTPPPTPPEL